jgi:hypothetical protein
MLMTVVSSDRSSSGLVRTFKMQQSKQGPAYGMMGHLQALLKEGGVLLPFC